MVRFRGQENDPEGEAMVRLSSLMYALALGVLAGCAPAPQPTCTDGLLNGTETDVDCGGPSCGPCVDARQCVADVDCKSGKCRGRACAPPSCSDGELNGAETDVDCGGDACAPCAAGKMCSKGPDCASAACMAGRCAVPPPPGVFLPVCSGADAAASSIAGGVPVCVGVGRIVLPISCSTGQALTSDGTTMSCVTLSTGGAATIRARITAVRAAVQGLATAITQVDGSGAYPAEIGRFRLVTPVPTCADRQILMASQQGVSCATFSGPPVQTPICTGEQLLSVIHVGDVSSFTCVGRGTESPAQSDLDDVTAMEGQMVTNGTALAGLEKRLGGLDRPAGLGMRPPDCQPGELLSFSAGKLVCTAVAGGGLRACQPMTGALTGGSDGARCTERSGYPTAMNIGARLDAVERGLSDAYLRLAALRCLTRGCQ